MSKVLIDQQIDTDLADNVSRSITEGKMRGVLKGVTAFADEVRLAVVALTASFVSRSLNLNAVIYVRGDTGSDTRTGEVNSGSASNGPVKTLERVIALHSGKTQKLSILISSGTLEVTSLLDIYIPELTIYIAPGATLRFRKRTGVLDTSNVVVGEGNWALRCYSNILNVRVDGLLDVEAHAGSTGAGDQFFYRAAQGALAICTDQYMVQGIAFQAIMLTHYGNVSVGNNTTLFTYGSIGNNFYGSELARYKRMVFGGSLTLGTGATESALNTDKLRETLVFEGSGSAKSFNIRRTYGFAFEIVYNDGCTITVQPAANCSANANNTLTFNGAVGKTVTVRLTSNIIL